MDLGTNSAFSRLLRCSQGNHSYRFLLVLGYDGPVRHRASLLATGILLADLETGPSP